MKYISVDYLVDLHCVAELNLHLHGVWITSAVKIGIYWLLVMKKKSLANTWFEFPAQKKCSIKRNFYPLRLWFHLSQFRWRLNLLKICCEKNVQRKLPCVNDKCKFMKSSFGFVNRKDSLAALYWLFQWITPYYAIKVRSVGSL